jgi:hypothetical protein
MKKILLRIMTLCFVASVGHCQEIASPLALTIKSYKQIYEVGEEIWIDSIFKNISKETIELLIWNGQTMSADNSRTINFPMYHFFEFRNEHGKGIASTGPSDIAKRPVAMERKKLLAGGEFVSKVPLHTWKLSGLGKGYNFIGSEARKIQIKGSYMVPEGFEFAVKEGERIFFGQLASNAITIEVKEKKLDVGFMARIKIIEADGSLRQKLDGILRRQVVMRSNYCLQSAPYRPIS